MQACVPLSVEAPTSGDGAQKGAYTVKVDKIRDKVIGPRANKKVFKAETHCERLSAGEQGCDLH